MSNATFHVYALLCPEDGLVHYVGKSKQIHSRFRSHIYTARSWMKTKGEPSVGSEVWVYGLVKRGLEPELAILEEVVSENESWVAVGKADREASDLEKAWIGRLQNAGHPLTNFNRAPCAVDVDLIEAAAERGRNLALSLGRGL